MTDVNKGHSRVKESRSEWEANMTLANQVKLPDSAPFLDRLNHIAELSKVDTFWTTKVSRKNKLA